MRWREHELGPWCLGTAQLGLDYGIANNHGKPSAEKALEIVASADALGIRLFDTATAYGDSHQVLGRCFAELGTTSQALTITKLSNDELFDDAVTQRVAQSAADVQTEAFFAVLAHSTGALEREDELVRVFRTLRDGRKSLHFGISVYSAEEAKHALHIDGIDIVQMPLNSLDHGAKVEGVIDLAKATGKLLCFRSVLLQGLLTINPAAIQPEAAQTCAILTEWKQLCDRVGYAPEVVALKVAQFLAQGFPLVIGAETAAQVIQNDAILRHEMQDVEAITEEVSYMAARTPETLRNPSKWPRNLLLTK